MTKNLLPHKKFIAFTSSLLIAIFCFFSASAMAITGSTSVCEGETVTYFVTPVPGATYSWNITGGNTLSSITADSLVIKWGMPGTGTIILTVNNSNNTQSFQTLNVTIKPKPNPAISHAPYPTCPSGPKGGNPMQSEGRDETCEKVCKNATIIYTTPLNAGSTYAWTVTGATTVLNPATNTVTVTWNSTLLGTLLVIETNAFGCKDSSKLCVEKVDLPIANFNHNINICKNANVLFNNTSLNATSYFWDFGDGGTSTAVNPTHQYTTGGAYTITLIAMNDCHCTDTFTSTINVNAVAGPTISCPSTVCVDDLATYSTPSMAGCIYTWAVTGGSITSGQGTSAVTIQWGAGQIGTLSLTVTGCGAVCTDPTIITIPIVPKIGIISGPAKLCPGECGEYSLPLFSGATYKWSLASSCGGTISDSTCCEKVEVCYPSFISGACNDVLTVTYYDSLLGCGGTASFIIKVRPKLQIFGSKKTCANSNTTYFANPAIPVNWSITPAGPVLSASPNSTVTVNWNGFSGNYTIFGVANNPNATCNDTAYIFVEVSPVPKAPKIMGDTIICANSTLNYCATGTGTNTINWIVTGGTPSSSIGNCITVTWGGAGPYQIQAFQQIPNSPSCKSNTTTKNITIFSPVPPTLNAVTSACANSTTAYSTTTLYPSGATFNWTLSPSYAGAITSGQGSSAINVEWGNTVPPNVTITLSVNVCGQVVMNSTTTTLIPVPTPTITQVGNLCTGGSASLQASVGFTSYSWTGPSGYTSAVNPAIITIPGLYQLTVTNANGCQGKTQINVQTVSGPVASISSNNILNYCTGAPISVTMCALGNVNYSYLWSPGSATTQCITATLPGSYTCQVTDNTNNCFTTSNAITITQSTCNPGSCTTSEVASFTNTTICNPITVTNTSTGGVTNFSWNFGDNTFFSGPNPPPHTYAIAGFYLITLTATAPNTPPGTGNCSLTDTAKVKIPLAANFDFKTGCNGTPVAFTNISTTTAGTTITSYSWNFGDASPNATTQNTTHTYALSGTYTASLTISDGTCTHTVTKTVTVAAGPTAGFTFNSPNCINSPITFTNVSTGGATAWSWNFGDLGTSLNQNPTHTYTSASVYPVMLTVKDAFGCTNSLSQNITISAPSVSGNITASDTLVCAGQNVLLVAPNCGTCTYLWSTGSSNDSIKVSSTGIYTVTITDANGCAYSTFIRIIVSAGPSTIITNNGNADICIGQFTSLSVPYSPNYTYSWLLNNVAIAPAQTNNTLFISGVTAGASNYSVIVVDTSTGCTDTSLNYTITVHPLPVSPTITVIGASTVCEGGTITLVGTHPNPNVTFLWSTGEVNDTIVVTEGGCYTLTVKNIFGCTSSATKCVTVNPLPELCQFFEGCYDTCAPYVIRGPSGAATYQWWLNGSAIVGANSQNYTAYVSGAYSVIVTSAQGCADTTGDLNLTLTHCDSLCAELVIDSIFCDRNRNYTLLYHVINNSGAPISDISLQVLAPNLSLLYSPNLTIQTVANGDTSTQLSATIYNGNSGDVLCFRSHITAYDSSGEELLCCPSDTVCVKLPPCPEDTSCCFFKYLGTKIDCKQTKEGIVYNFSATINGCGTMNITQAGGSGTLSGIVNPYILNGGTITINGTYTTSSDKKLCLTYTMMDNGKFCKDTTICFDLRCDNEVPECKLRFDDNICVGQSSSFSYGGNPLGLTFNWQFTSGTPSAATGPGPHNVTYTAVGCHPVICIINKGIAGERKCIDTICVSAAPIATISISGNSLLASPSGNSYQWFTQNPFVAIPSAINQFYSPSQTGVYCVVVTNKVGCADTACSDFDYVGVNNRLLNQWSVYPNPSDGNFNLSFEGFNNENLEIRITNTIGQIVGYKLLTAKVGNQTFNIENTNLSPGIYYVQLKTNDGLMIKPIAVK